MGRERYQYTFKSHLAFDQIEPSLHLAIVAVEGMHGEARVRMDVRYTVDAKARLIEIDADTPSGQRTNEIFIQYLHREFGPDAFQVYRVIARAPSPRLN